MKRLLQATLLFAGIVTHGHAHAQQVDMDYSGAVARQVTVPEANQLRVVPQTDGRGNPVWNFRVRHLVGGTSMQFRVDQEGNTESQHAYVSFDAGGHWQSVSPIASQAPRSHIYHVDIPDDATNCLFASPLPISHPRIRGWMESMVDPGKGVSIQTFGTANDVIEMLRICEGDKVEARRPVVLIYVDDDVTTAHTAAVALGLAEWLIHSSLEAVWLRQNVETIIIPSSNTANPKADTQKVRLNLESLIQAYAGEERLLLPLQITRSLASATEPELLIPEKESLPICRNFIKANPLTYSVKDIPHPIFTIPWNRGHAKLEDLHQLGAQWGRIMNDVLSTSTQ